MRDKERSSCGVREEAKIERSTAGVTGMRLCESAGSCWTAVGWVGRSVRVEVVDAEEDIEWVTSRVICENGLRCPDSTIDCIYSESSVILRCFTRPLGFNLNIPVL
ncbi:hypothetical protein E4T56_gene16254 [Termitomyces sp. T112]|nr:hypothetical protein E4T56_gene16254 [Termitomyces sp. T112]